MQKYHQKGLEVPVAGKWSQPRACQNLDNALRSMIGFLGCPLQGQGLDFDGSFLTWDIL